MSAPDPARTDSGTVKLTPGEMAYLNSFLDAGDRGGFYLAYYNMTGSAQALVQAKISTFSEELGGMAYASNRLLQSAFGPTNYAGIYYLSQQVALGARDAILADIRDIGTGHITDARMFSAASGAWALEGQSSQFPATILDWESVARSIVYGSSASSRMAAQLEVLYSTLTGLQNAGMPLTAALLRASVTPGVEAALLSTLSAGVVGKSQADFENNPAYTLQLIPDGSFRVAIDNASGKVVGVFNNVFLPFPLIELILEKLVAVYGSDIWDAFLPVIREYLLDLRLHLTESSQPYNGDNPALNGKANAVFSSLASKPSLEATTGSDTIWGSPFRTTLNGGGGDDFLFGDSKRGQAQSLAPFIPLAPLYPLYLYL